jgi:NAD(P)H-hydrate epimerase
MKGLIAAIVRNIKIPLVFDADGLNALVNHTDHLRGHTAPLILTPHPGEFARLLGRDVPYVQAHRQELAAQFAENFSVIVVLKGQGTIVTDGRRVYQNLTGNPGMATGGTGDVLTGVIAALVGQGLEPFAATQLGVYLHGSAGDLAQDEVGPVSLIASDLLSFLPKAFCQYCSG